MRQEIGSKTLEPDQHGSVDLDLEKISASTELATGSTDSDAGLLGFLSKIGTGPVPEAFKASEHQVRYILEHCPAPQSLLLAILGEIGTGLLPAALGGKELELRRPTALFATRLLGPGPAAWSSYCFHQKPNGVSLHALTTEVSPGAVRFDAATGTIHVEVAALPRDGRWHLYCLARGDLFRSTPSNREVFAVSRATCDPDRALGPAELLHQGCLAEAWTLALEENWSDPALIALLLLLLPAMTRLIASALQTPRLAVPEHSFLCDELRQVPQRCLQNHQQALIDFIEPASSETS